MQSKSLGLSLLFWGLLLGALLWILFFSINPSGPQCALFYDSGKSLYSDFYMIQDYLREADYYRPVSHAWHDSNYVALVRFFFSPFPYSLSGAVAFTILSAVAYLIAVAIFANKRQLPVVWTLVGTMCTYNFISVLERGNSIIFSAAAVVLFLAWFDSEVRWQRTVAAVALAFAGVSKISPALLGFLYFRKRQWREIILCAIAAGVLFFVPFFLPGCGGFDGIRQWFLNARANSQYYALYGSYGFPKLMYGVRDVLVSVGVAGPARGVAAVRPLSPVFGLGVFVASFFARKESIRVFLTIAALLIMPGNQHGYCGLYLIPVLFWVVRDESKLWLVFIVLMMFFSFRFPIPLVAALMGMVQNLALMGLCVYFIGRMLIDWRRERKNGYER